MSSDLYSYWNLWRQYRACRRNKRNTLNALAFELGAETKLLALQRELRERTYQPGRSICFITEGPKPREVFAADFRDRIVHHLLVSRVEPIFEPRFIHDSYACRTGKGVLAASDRLMQFLRSVTANGRRSAWAMKLDVASFFPSIHKQTLFDLICRRVRDPELRWLTSAILFHDPSRDYQFKPGRARVPPPGSARYPIPEQPLDTALRAYSGQSVWPLAPSRCPERSEGHRIEGFWANVYLNEVDQLVKRRLRCRWYVRYVDDLILLAEQPRDLLHWREAVRGFLRAHLKLELRSQGDEPFPVRRGVDSVGWKTWRNHRVPRWRTLRNLDLSLSKSKAEAVKDDGDVAWIRLRQPSPGRAPSVQRIAPVLASYSGHLRHGAAWNQWSDTLRRHRWLDALFTTNGWKVMARWVARRIPGATASGASTPS